MRFSMDLQQSVDDMSNEDATLVINDRNPKADDTKVSRTAGKFGLGKRNEVGKKLIEFDQDNSMAIRNTFFQQSKRRIYKCTFLE